MKQCSKNIMHLIVLSPIHKMILVSILIPLSIVKWNFTTKIKYTRKSIYFSIQFPKSTLQHRSRTSSIHYNQSFSRHFSTFYYFFLLFPYPFEDFTNLLNLVPLIETIRLRDVIIRVVRWREREEEGGGGREPSWSVESVITRIRLRLFRVAGDYVTREEIRFSRRWSVQFH